MKTSRCKACRSEIAFLRTDNGGFMPTDWESLGSVDQRNYLEGLRVYFDPKRGHITHLSTCPDAAKFRKKKAEEENGK